MFIMLCYLKELVEQMLPAVGICKHNFIKLKLCPLIVAAFKLQEEFSRPTETIWSACHECLLSDPIRKILVNSWLKEMTCERRYLTGKSLTSINYRGLHFTSLFKATDV